MRRQRMRAFGLAAAGALIACLTVFAQPAHAEDADCLPGIGKRLPVVMVHGFSSDDNIWSKGDSNMQSVIKAIESVYTTTLNYGGSSMRWVDHPEIGPKLAKQIHCIAANSRKAGGYGRVVVVAHSMGGLATQYASNLAVDGRNVSRDLGLVITIGTPYLGSKLADWVINLSDSLCNKQVAVRLGLQTAGFDVNECHKYVNQLEALDGLQRNSDKLRQLKPFPANVPVQAIAGDVGEIKINLFGTILKANHSDKVVAVKSAIQRAAHKAAGGGFGVVECVGAYPFPSAPFLASDASCEHGNLVKDRHVQARTVDSIRQYQTYLKRQASEATQPKFSRWFKFGNLQVPQLTGWRVETDSGDPTHKKLVKGDSSLDFVSSGKPWSFYLPCGSEGSESEDYPIVYKRLYTVGSHKAAYYEQRLCYGDGQIMRYWELPKSRIVIFTSATGKELAQIKTMLANARWQ